MVRWSLPPDRWLNADVSDVLRVRPVVVLVLGVELCKDQVWGLILLMTVLLLLVDWCRWSGISDSGWMLMILIVVVCSAEREYLLHDNSG
ncbi:hypothetical protein BJX70DRAFT_361980 [Aspergillus crustosus]